MTGPGHGQMSIHWLLALTTLLRIIRTITFQYRTLATWGMTCMTACLIQPRLVVQIVCWPIFVAPLLTYPLKFLTDHHENETHHGSHHVSIAPVPPQRSEEHTSE